MLAEQCVQRCQQIATHSEIEGETTRGFLTPPMKDVHNLITDWMTQLSMQVRTDDAGNLVGRRTNDSTEQPTNNTLLIGSHLDTVPNAGAFDGVLGVIIGLAVVEATNADSLSFNLDVVGFSEEEGVRFSQPYIGSQAIAGSFDPSSLARVDANGKTMAGAIADFGLDANKIPAAAYSADEVIGFVEPHIEQGPLLGHLRHPLAWVENIAGQSRLIVRFLGAPSHAGTTPMELRRDALVAASSFVTQVKDYAVAKDVRATVGSMSVAPNVRNVVPGEVELSIDIRHAQDKVREKAVLELCEKANQIAKTANLAFEVMEKQSQPAATMDKSLSSELKSAIGACGFPDSGMVSGAGHDAAIMSTAFPTAMLFIRQESGISHHPDEDVEVGDVACAIEVLTEFVRLKSRNTKEN